MSGTPQASASSAGAGACAAGESKVMYPRWKGSFLEDPTCWVGRYHYHNQPLTCLEQHVYTCALVIKVESPFTSQEQTDNRHKNYEILGSE